MRLVVARIGRAHGLRGEVTVELRTDAPDERFFDGARLFVCDGARHRELVAAGLPTTLTVRTVRDHNSVLLLGFEEVPDRTAAEAMRDTLVECDVPDDEDEPDAWYDHQLVGLRVHDPGGALLGEVVGVEHRPVQDLLVVRRPSGQERMVPFVQALVPEVDVSGGRIVIAAPRGLLDDGDETDEPGPDAGAGA